MRFQELHIETRRERPARARTDGESYLIRAGYYDAQARLTELGDRSISRLRRLVGDSRDLLDSFGLSVLRTVDAEIVAEMPKGEFLLIRCRNCGYAASVETARARKVPLPPEPPLPIE